MITGEVGATDGTRARLVRTPAAEVTAHHQRLHDPDDEHWIVTDERGTKTVHLRRRT
jgi:hypothetical protein